MAGNFEGIRQSNFGIEIEMTGLTRCQAAKAIAKVLGGIPKMELHSENDSDRSELRLVNRNGRTKPPVTSVLPPCATIDKKSGKHPMKTRKPL